MTAVPTDSGGAGIWTALTSPDTLRGPQAKENTFRWATVTTVNPLAIQLDGDTAPLPMEPEALVANASLVVGTRVWVQMFGRRVIVLGASSGSPLASTRQIFTGSGSWAKPAGARQVLIQVVGGGGAGGGSSITAAGEWSFGDGGGAGEYAEGLVAASTLGATETVTIGAGGTGVAGAAGNNGGTSSFGAAGTLISAVGGGGGAQRPNTSSTSLVFSNNNALRVGGSGGTGGTIRVPGGNGGSGLVVLGTSGAGGKGGDGGQGRFSGGGLAGVINVGSNAGGWGGGGGGAHATVSTAAARAGGNGSGGVVIVTTYF